MDSWVIERHLFNNTGYAALTCRIITNYKLGRM